MRSFGLSENIRILEVSSRKIFNFSRLSGILYQSVLPRINKVSGDTDSNVYCKGENLSACNAVLEKTDHFS